MSSKAIFRSLQRSFDNYIIKQFKSFFHFFLPTLPTSTWQTVAIILIIKNICKITYFMNYNTSRSWHTFYTLWKWYHISSFWSFKGQIITKPIISLPQNCSKNLHSRRLSPKSHGYFSIRMENRILQITDFNRVSVWSKCRKLKY